MSGQFSAGFQWLTSDDGKERTKQPYVDFPTDCQHYEIYNGDKKDYKKFLKSFDMGDSYTYLSWVKQIADNAPKKLHTMPSSMPDVSEKFIQNYNMMVLKADKYTSASGMTFAQLEQSHPTAAAVVLQGEQDFFEVTEQLRALKTSPKASPGKGSGGSSNTKKTSKEGSGIVKKKKRSNDKGSDSADDEEGGTDDDEEGRPRQFARKGLSSKGKTPYGDGDDDKNKTGSLDIRLQGPGDKALAGSLAYGVMLAMENMVTEHHQSATAVIQLRSRVKNNMDYLRSLVELESTGKYPGLKDTALQGMLEEFLKAYNEHDYCKGKTPSQKFENMVLQIANDAGMKGEMQKVLQELKVPN
jgi:hypothetical protein